MTAEPTRLRRPFPLDAAFIADAADLSATEMGALAALTVWWWSRGTLPRTPSEAGRALRIQSGHAAAMVARLAPRFAPGTYLRTLRDAHIVKAQRRAKAGQKGFVAMQRKLAEASPRH